jgi:hypothetical protein
MDLVTQKEFADMVGVQKQTIATQIKRGTIRKYKKTTKINLDDPIIKSYLATRGRKVSYKSDAKVVAKSKKSDNNDKVFKEEVVQDSSDNGIKKLYWEAERIKQAAIKLETDQKKARGNLIKRSLVQRVFAKLYTVDTNELLPLKDRLSPEIAALVGVDDPELILKINKRIEKEIYKSLKHIKRLMDDFLESIEVEATEHE